jgi:hypothetical protein
MQSKRPAPAPAPFHRAKVLESRLEQRVQAYSSLAQRINADLICDEENPLIGGGEERALATDIENDLAELLECINNMRTASNEASAGSNEDILVRRHHEIHFDYSTEFKNISATVHRKRESMDLFASSKKLSTATGAGAGAGGDSSVDMLLRERSSIAASMRSINEVIAQAFDAKSGLLGQRGALGGASLGLAGIANNVPSFNRLIDGITRKKLKETLIVALFCGVLLCFTIWWVFLR